MIDELVKQFIIAMIGITVFYANILIVNESSVKEKLTVNGARSYIAFLGTILAVWFLLHATRFSSVAIDIAAFVHSDLISSITGIATFISAIFVVATAIVLILVYIQTRNADEDKQSEATKWWSIGSMIILVMVGILIYKFNGLGSSKL